MSLNTFDRAKLRQNFVPANQRPSCCNCDHGFELTNPKPAGWRCMKGGFFCSARAVCDQHQPKQPPRTST